MATDDTYQGWSNRETWCMNLWLTHGEGIYRNTREIALEAKSNCAAANEIEEMVLNLFCQNGDSSILRTMRDDVGSLWRINWVEIAESFRGD